MTRDEICGIVQSETKNNYFAERNASDEEHLFRYLLYERVAAGYLPE